MTTPPIAAAAARQLASDNFAPVHPRVLERIAAVNHGHAMAYGDDAVTARARAAFSRLFGQEVAAHFVFNGTAANNLALSAFARSYGAVVCSDVAHLCNDESTAPERVLGMRVLPVPGRDGKIPVEGLRAVLGRGHGVHAVKPVAISITQPTELGTVYGVEELRELARVAHEHGLGVHVDGARLGCAVASLGRSARELLVDTGVDVVSFGGTKQGMLVGEAVVFLRPGIGAEFPYWQKHAMQLASKMRFVSAQFEALLEDDLWVENGRHANAMAQLLLAALREERRVEVVYPVEANAVFGRIPPELIEPLQRETFFWPWDERRGVVRWMCAFDTEAEDVHRFAAQLRAALDRRQGAARP